MYLELSHNQLTSTQTRLRACQLLVSESSGEGDAPDQTTVLAAPCKNLDNTMTQYGVKSMNTINAPSSTSTATTSGSLLQGYRSKKYAIGKETTTFFRAEAVDSGEKQGRT